MTTASPIAVTQDGGDVLFSVRVTPKAKRVALSGVHDGAVKAAVTEPPEKGKANAAVIALVARALGVPKRSVTIEGAATSRVKRIRVGDMTRALLLHRLRELGAVESEH